MNATEAIRKALDDPMTAITGAMVAQGPQGDWDFFFRGTPPHHYEQGGRMVKWDLDEQLSLTIEHQVAAEAQGMSGEDLDTLIEQLAMQVAD